MKTAIDFERQTEQARPAMLKQKAELKERERQRVFNHILNLVDAASKEGEYKIRFDVSKFNGNPDNVRDLIRKHGLYYHCHDSTPERTIFWGPRAKYFFEKKKIERVNNCVAKLFAGLIVVVLLTAIYLNI